ncbi:MAG: hypothetical protein ACOX44_00265 [Limnochordia bacterium]|jgi:hypothetical protein
MMRLVRYLGWVTLLCLFAMGSIASALELGPELLKNPDLEQFSESGAPESWTVNLWSTDATVQMDTTTAHSGEKSVRIHAPAGARGSIWQYGAVKAGHTYRFSVWYRTQKDLAGDAIYARLYTHSPTVPWDYSWFIDLNEGDFEITNSGNLHVYGVNTRGEWKQLTATFTLPADIPSTRVRVEFFNYRGLTDLWVDSFSFREVLQ